MFPTSSDEHNFLIRQFSYYLSCIYGDFCSGLIWALNYDGTKIVDVTILVDSDLIISSFGEDEEGELYILSFDNKIYRLKLNE